MRRILDGEDSEADERVSDWERDLEEQRDPTPARPSVESESRLEMMDRAGTYVRGDTEAESSARSARGVSPPRSVGTQRRVERRQLPAVNARETWSPPLFRPDLGSMDPGLPQASSSSAFLGAESRLPRSPSPGGKRRRDVSSEDDSRFSARQRIREPERERHRRTSSREDARSRKGRGPVRP